MAYLHATATLTPSKLELIQGWLPSREWCHDLGAGQADRLASYRLDDPDDRVGLEGHLLRAASGAVLHVPLTYRDAPLSGSDQHLLGTAQHSVLGTRWVYDACADPVFAAALATVVLTGGTQAEELAGDENGVHRQPPSVTVAGSGTPGTAVPRILALTVRDAGQTSVIQAGQLRVTVARVVGAAVLSPFTLTGSWAGTSGAVLAGVTQRPPG